MKAIRIKWLGPTNTRGARYSLSADGWPTKTFPKEYGDGDSPRELVAKYFEFLRSKGVRLGGNVRVAVGTLPNGDDAAVLFAPGDDFPIWHVTPKSNPAARKKRVSKKKAAPRKKTAAKKKAAAKKRIAINAPSRATGKPPSKRLRSRRARNTVPGAYPNPKARKRTVSHNIYALAMYGGEPRLYIFDGDKFVPSWAEGKRYASAAAAKRAMDGLKGNVPAKVKMLGVFPVTQSDSVVFREFTGKFRGMGK